MVLLKKQKKQKQGKKPTTKPRPSLVYYIQLLNLPTTKKGLVTKLKWQSLLSPGGKKNKKKYQFSISDNMS